MRRIPTWLIALAGSLVVLTGSAAAQCQRHFYNDSAVPFTVGMAASGLCNNFTICVVNPHTTSTLIYFPNPVGLIGIRSVYGVHQFNVAGCYIIHGGSTGEIAVNDPVDGDVTTCGREWSCPGLRRKKSRK